MSTKTDQAGGLVTSAADARDRPEQFVRENAGWMLALAERITRERALAEDVVQDALINALKGLEQFAEQSSLKTWLHRITVNAAVSKLRKMKRLSELSIDDLQPEFDRFDCRIEQPWSRLASTDDIVEDAERRNLVAEGIYRLPDAYRIVLQLRDIEGYDTAETAELLETSVSNVKVRLHRARAALKRILEPLLRREAAE